MTFTNVSADVAYLYDSGGGGGAGVFSSIDGFGDESNALGTIWRTRTDGWGTLSIALGPDFVKLTEPVEFRVYVHDDKGRSAHGVHIANIRLQGRAYPYPGLVITIL